METTRSIIQKLQTEGDNFRRWFYETAAANMSTLVVVGVLLYDYTYQYGIDHRFGWLFFVIPLALVLLSIAPYFLGLKPPYEANMGLFALYYLVLYGFLVFFVPATGPYGILLIFMMFAFIYWFGLAGLIASTLANFLILASSLSYQNDPITSDLAHETAIYFALLGSLSILFTYILTSNRTERARIARLKDEATLDRERLTVLINSMQEGVAATDEKGRILMYNGAMLNLLNTNVSLEGKSLDGVLKLTTLKGKSLNLLKDVTKTQAGLVRDDVKLEAGDDDHMVLWVNVAPLRTSFGGEVQDGYLCIMRDITKEKDLETQKDEFISVTSHELRTPIATAEANLSTALMPQIAKKMPAQSKELLKQAHEDVLYLGGLVNDLSTLARAESNLLKVVYKPITLRPFIDDIKDDYRQKAKAAGLDLVTRIEKGVPTQIHTDELSLREILQNFITNAIKYSKDGTVRVRVYRSDDKKSIIFAVKDNGIGISKTDQKKLFTKFFRAEDYRTRETNGTGLGLYITLRLAERIKGRIWFDSKLNHGSTFYLEIPAKKPRSKKKDNNAE